MVLKFAGTGVIEWSFMDFIIVLVGVFIKIKKKPREIILRAFL
jgi:hypothetical protein